MTPTLRRPFGANGFGRSITQQSLGKPGAVYPGAVATDSDMIIAVDRQQTTLALPVNVSDSSMTVVDPSLIKAYNLLSIDSEIVKTTGPPAANVVPIIRGFDGTTPAIHLAGATVSGLIDAYHHNRLVAEVEAIEQALGPNLANVPGSAMITAPPYDFAAQTPGGTLNPGTNLITLSPVPRGVNGADTNHYLYISGGTGTAEAVPITGGTAVSGAASGTVFVTCANAHSGAWTVRSATAGAQEAHNANPGALVFYPAGTFDWYGTFWSNGLTGIIGNGMSATVLRFNSTTRKMLDIERDGFLFKNLTLQQVGTPVAGNVGLYIAGSGGSVSSATLYGATIEDVLIRGFYDGLSIDGGLNLILSRPNIANCVHDCLVANSTQGYWHDVVVQNSGNNGVTMTNVLTTLIEGLQTFNNGGWGVHAVNSILYISGMSSFFNADHAGEIYLINSRAYSGWLKDASIQYAGATVSWGTNNTAPGVFIDAGSGPLLIDNVQFYQSQGNSIEIKNNLNIITNCMEVASGYGAQAGNIYAIKMDTGSQQLSVSNSTFFSPIQLRGTGNLVIGNTFEGPASVSVPLVEVLTGTVIIDDNFFNQAGSGPALQFDAGVQYLDGNNTIFTGSVVDNGNRDGAARPNSRFRVVARGPAVASAATITAPAMVFQVSGTAAISNINPGCTVNNVSASQITIIPTGVFTLVTGGNISLNSTAVLFKPLTLTFDGATLMWYPSY